MSFSEIKVNDIAINAYAAYPTNYDRVVNYAIVPESEVPLGDTFYSKSVSVKGSIIFTPYITDQDHPTVSTTCRLIFFLYNKGFKPNLSKILDINATKPHNNMYAHSNLAADSQYRILYDKTITPKKGSRDPLRYIYQFARTFEIREWSVHDVIDNSISFGYIFFLNKEKSKNIKMKGFLRHRYRTKN